MSHEKIIAATQQWVETIVVGLNLCPFAKRELIKQSLYFEVSEANTEEALLDDLQQALAFISAEPTVETSLLIHPYVLQDFYAYNEFLNYADALLVQMGLEGVYQIASFHPDYQFADTSPDEACNYTNKSPYPMLHLLSEASVEKALENHPDPAAIPERNMQLLESMGQAKIQALLDECEQA